MKLQPNQAGYVREENTDTGAPVRFRVQRLTDSGYGLDTVDVRQDKKYDGVLQPVEISTASWRGTIEQTRAFALTLLKACDLAEERQVEVEAPCVPGAGEPCDARR